MRTLLLAGVMAVASVGIARADVITTFAVTGTFQSGSTLGGTLTIDTTTGSIVNGLITIAGTTTASLNHFSLTQLWAGGIQIVGTDDVTTQDDLLLLHPTADSFIGYVGGPIDDGEYLATEPFPLSRTLAEDPLVSGSGALTAATAVPEPASFALLGVGVAGVAARRWRRAS